MTQGKHNRITTIDRVRLAVTVVLVASGITGAAYTMAALKNPPQTMQTTQSSATQKLPAALRNGAANTRYGISLSESFSHLQADQMAAQLQQIKQLGFTDIRFTVSWYGVQPTNATTYNWKQYDTLVSAVSASGLHGLAIINYTPAWARAAACPATAYCMPANLHEYATFAAATARRYAPQGLHHYELWNEENIKSFWQPAPSASSYASLLKAAYPAIKAADADSVVVTGGMSGVSVASPGYSEPRDYLTALYQDGAGNDFDAVGYHAYTFPDSPNDSDGGKNAWSKIANAQPSLRSIMAAHGDAAKPIWVTEVGAPTDGPGSTVGDGMRRSANSDHVTPSMQASIAEQVLQDSKQTPGLGALFWYTYQDLGTSQSNNENFFGLQSKSRAPKPALSIFSRFLQNRSN